MPRETDPKDKSSVITNRLKHISILMMLSLLCASVTGMYVSGTDVFSIRNCIYGCAFVLSFGFLLVYYIDVNRENILSVRSSRLVLVLIPSVCLFILHCGNVEIASYTLIVLLALLSGCFNFTLSALTLFMLYVYGVFFPAFTVVPSVGTVLFIFSVCLFARNVFTVKNSIYSALIVTVFYSIVLLIESDFRSDLLFTSEHILVLVCGIVSLVGVRFLVMLLSKGFKGTSAISFTIPSDAVSEMDDESSGSFMFTEKEHQEEEPQNLDDYVTREEFDKLGDRLSRVYKERDELQEQLLEIKDKKNTLTIAEVCAEEFMYLVRLKLDNPSVYEHTLTLARLSSGASEAIQCDSDLAYALGIIHDSGKILGNDFLEILGTKYGVPEFLIKPLYHMSVKKVDFPIMRETGIVMLVNDMINTYDHVMRNIDLIKKTNEDYDVSWAGIVKNTIKVRNTQNFLRYSGFSAAEVNIIKEYLINNGF